MTPIEGLKILKSKIDEAEFYKCNYVLQTNNVEAINQTLTIPAVVVRSEQLPCEMCGGNIDKEDKFTDEKHCENCGWF